MLFNFYRENLLAWLSVRTYLPPLAGTYIARACFSWRESRVEYYLLHTAEYAIAFLAFNWLYFLAWDKNR